MAVGIPFPTGKDDLVIEDLEQLLEDLQKEGALTSFNPIQIVENEENNIRTTWLGRYFLLEYPQKAMTSSRLISLHYRKGSWSLHMLYVKSCEFFLFF